MATSSGMTTDQLAYVPAPNVTVASLTKVGKVKLSINNQEIVLLSHKGAIHAIQAKCPHQGGPLEQGEIEDLGKSGCIRCPWHSWKFDLSSGDCVSPGPNPDKKMKVYPVQINNQEIKVGFPKRLTSKWGLVQGEHVKSQSQK